MAFFRNAPSRAARPSARAIVIASRAAGVFLLLVGAIVLSPRPVYAAGPNAVMTPTGYNVHVIPRADDTSNLVVNLPFAMNWNGNNYSQIYINMNGNCTFGSGFQAYNMSQTLAATGQSIMAPLWSDVDTRNTAAGQVTYSDTSAGNVPQVNGRDAFFVNWIDVASYNNQYTPTNSFQLVLVDRSDTGLGNFDFIFNYDRVTWDWVSFYSTARARAGWGLNGTGFELPGSGVYYSAPSALLDTSPAATSLIQNSMNSGGQLGRYVFEVRSGQAPNIPPQVTVNDRVLEGNATGGYAGYSGTGDASAIDLDGTIVSLTNDRPAFLPLGTTNVTWTATDDRGAVTTAVQQIVVQDTIPPVNPTLASPTHSVGAWTTQNQIAMNASGSTDVCSGVTGFSYGWSAGSPATPDTVLDPSSSSTVTNDGVTVVHSESFPDANWSAGWTPTASQYLQLTNAAGRSRSSYAAEVWSSNNQRRTADFYRDYDLTGISTATLTFWDNVAISGGQDYAIAEYSTNAGASYTTLQDLDTTSGWTQRSFALPTGGVVRVRFSASVNRSYEYVDWDDIAVTGVTPTTVTSRSASVTSTLADGTWYFNLHATDASGNWSTPVNRGPFLIDTTAPVTTDDAPTGWSPGDVSVVLTPTDAGQITYTRYSLNGGAWTDYTGAIVVSVEGESTLLYYSADAAGHTEAVKSATIRIDTVPPLAPGSPIGSALSTDTIAVTWTASTDVGSGVTGYRIYRDGVAVGTTSMLTYTDSGLTSGQTYTYRVSALDAAGNESALSLPVTVTTPSAAISISVSTTDVDMGEIEPEVTSTMNAATTVTVEGIGGLSYDLECSAPDFVNVDLGSATPTMPIGVLGFTTHGWVEAPFRAFQNGPVRIGTGTGSLSSWAHAYTFDYSLNVPLTIEPGTYTCEILYSVVMR